MTTLIAVTVEARAGTDSRTSRSDTVASTARRIVVSISDRRLALVEGGRVIKIYRTAVGAPKSPSPLGTYEIVNRLSHPTYFAPGKVIPPGPANPLGTRWLGLSLDGYGIHGTNQPRSIGRAVSHGCVRLRNEDIEDLFLRVRPGDQVEIIRDGSKERSRIFDPDAIAAPPSPTPPNPERN